MKEEKYKILKDILDRKISCKEGMDKLIKLGYKRSSAKIMAYFPANHLPEDYEKTRN